MVLSVASRIASWLPIGGTQFEDLTMTAVYGPLKRFFFGIVFLTKRSRIMLRKKQEIFLGIHSNQNRNKVWARIQRFFLMLLDPGRETKGIALWPTNNVCRIFMPYWKGSCPVSFPWKS